MIDLPSQPGLAPWAAHDHLTQGREHFEPPAFPRHEFQRDRDRVIHSTAFRRLMYKTQVFVNHEGDMYRTRLTHSIEVAQIGRSVALALGLNEPLTEAICLAHDLGHTPFGHAGQDALNACMCDYGGFEHNLQSLRVVDLLEEKYADYPGLNLCFETREGILKHCSKRNARELGKVGERFLQRRQPGLEAQLANLADEIAYNNHDVDDGLRAEMISIDQLREIALFDASHREVREMYQSANRKIEIHETVRRMINTVVSDLTEQSRGRIEAAAPASIEDVRNHDSELIAMSDELRQQHLELKRFLRDSLYHHEHVQRMTGKAAETITVLFECYMNDLTLLPDSHQRRVDKENPGKHSQARVIADYIAGMTDRFALKEHERLTGEGEH